MVKQAKRDVALQNAVQGGVQPQSDSRPAGALNRKQIAALGEEAAYRHLLKLGYNLICRNWRSGRFGEIDLIMESPEGILVFVEVKTRRRALIREDCHDGGFEAVDWRKQRKILICMRSYLARSRQADTSCRADICLVYYAKALAGDTGGSLSDVSILHVIDAFDASR